jgi:hypothetical protein
MKVCFTRLTGIIISISIYCIDQQLNLEKNQMNGYWSKNTGLPSGVWTDYSSGAHEITPEFSGNPVVIKDGIYGKIGL